ncbi:MAG: putative drug exporter of the superfamily [Solirubrobacteraceae bacterium]|nr:putative drug exporter of the superfamily [Solirubrobacteraceae bacterium]
MRRVAAIVAGRRAKWGVIAVWVVLIVVCAPLGSKLKDQTSDDTATFLPRKAESTAVLKALNRDFPGGQTSSGIVVYQRPGGLGAADRARIARDARRIARAAPLVGRPVVPFAPRAPPSLVSRDRSVAFMTFAVPDKYDKLADWGKAIKKALGPSGGGLHVYVTGDVGFNADAQEIFGSIDATLLLVTVILVLVLLGAIYRSPIVAVIPIVVVGVAYTVAQAGIYLYAKSGATVSSDSTSILVVLMFGVGTDYCLLLVSRYREELRRTRDKHDAMRHAVTRAGPAILASGLTVALSMLVLLVAQTGSTHALGPVAAIGVVSALLAGLTLLPALLTIAGRRGFWPRQRLVEFAGDGGAEEAPGRWRRFGNRVVSRPGWALGLSTLLFAAGGLGLLAYKEDYSTTTFFKKPTQSVDGFKVLQRAFPAGVLSPTTVLVRREAGRLRPADVRAAELRLSTVRGVAGVAPTGARSRDGREATLNVVLSSDPYRKSALDVVPRMRRALDDLPPGVAGLVGGGSAVQYDFDQSTTRDLKLIVPIALAVIAVILAVLLQALLAPLVLIATVVASFFGTLGLALLFIRYVVGDAGVNNGLPTFAFIFLVALGIDYTIFLMSRVREEARRHGTREGTLRALSATGPVINSAGIILAGTFSVLMTLPVKFTFDLGFMVALGILLDTFVVRTIMVPAALELIGDRIWWPSTAQGGSVLGEEVEDPDRELEPV